MASIKDFIKSGNEKIKKDAAEIKAREERKEALLLIEAGKRNDMAIELLPEVLRQYARVEDDCVLVVSVPNCDDIVRKFKVTSAAWGPSGWSWDKVEFSQKGWRGRTWDVFQGDDGRWDTYRKLTGEGTDDLERALAYARTMSTSLETAQIEADERNAKQHPKVEETKPDKFIPLCPLRMMGGLEFDDCVEDRCAWFTEFRGVKTCVVKVIGLPMED